jgi:hypothetical protein
VDVPDILEARRYLSHIGVWPGPRQLDVEGWLDNFDTDEDRGIALALIESYVHINEEQIGYAVCSTIRSISTQPEFGEAENRQAKWREFTAKVIISFPLGEAGDSTASGYIFARIASRLGFPAARISDSEHLVGRLAASDTSHPVIFLDDLAASGTQFTRNWTRKYPTDHGPLTLYEQHTGSTLSTVYYLPVVSTTTAKNKIEAECNVTVLPTYLLDDDYGALADETRLVGTSMRAALPRFLEKYGARTGNAQFGTAGFGGLGLALSFHHGSPNNTLPVLQWGRAQPDWNPLVNGDL